MYWLYIFKIWLIKENSYGITVLNLRRFIMQMMHIIINVTASMYVRSYIHHYNVSTMPLSVAIRDCIQCMRLCPMFTGCSLLAIRRPSGGWGTAISPGHWMAYATDWPIQMMQHCCWLQLYLPSHNSSIGWMAVCHSPNGVRIAIAPGMLHEKCEIHLINHWARKVSSSVKSDKMSLYTYSYVYVLRQNLIIKLFTVVK